MGGQEVTFLRQQDRGEKTWGKRSKTQGIVGQNPGETGAKHRENGSWKSVS